MKKANGISFFVLFGIAVISIFIEFRALNGRITAHIIMGVLFLLIILFFGYLRMGRIGKRQVSVWSGQLKLIPIAIGAIAGFLFWWLQLHFHVNR